MVRIYSAGLILLFGGLLVSGCAKPSSTSNSSGTTGQSDSKSTSKSSAGSEEKKTEYWEDYPDVPKYEIMTEVDGIKVRRMPADSATLQLTGPIQADVGNELAKQKPSEPTTGDTLTVRFNAEPKVLNPITESSAYMHYIMQYVNDMLARQNPETFEFEPGQAKKWIIEDSIKLSADYPGRERRISLNDEAGKASFELDYPATPVVDGKPGEPKKFTIKTTDKDGKPVGHTWVGLFAAEPIPGASRTGYHEWSNDQGVVEISGLPAGKYVVKTGDEVYGLSEPQADGSLTVKPGSAENPLREPMTLKAGEWQDIQAKTYGTFYLNENAKWSDGVPFTTKDVEFAYALINSNFVDGDHIRTYYSDLVECTALGTHTVRMRFRQQYFMASEFMFQLTFHSAPFHFFEEIFRAQGRELTLQSLTPEQEAANKQISVRGQEFGKFFNTDERYNSKPLGNGPYIVDKWERKDRVELVRNPNFWDTPKAGHIDRIIIRFIPDQVTAMTALRAGEIDFFYSMEADQYFDDWNTLDKQTQEKYVRASWFSPGFQYVGWSQLKNPLKDRRVRLALTMLFDRQDFIDKKLHGEAVVVSGPQYYFGPAYDRDVAPIAYDPEGARELLTDAGWIDTDNDGILDRNGEKLSILLRMPLGRAIYTQIFEVMQKNFKSVGIDMQLQTMEWASFIEKARAKENDAYMARWAIPIESDPFQIWHGSEAAPEKRGSNMISFKNAKVDELIEMMRVTIDPNKRRRIHQSFHRLVDSEQPYTFLWMQKEFGAYHRRFRNVKWYRLRPGFDLTEWYVPKDEQLHK